MKEYSANILYTKITSLGFKRKYITSMLPEWWNDSIAQTQAGFTQMAVLLAKAFSLDFKSLISESDIKFNLPSPNFKARTNIDYSDLTNAVALSTVAAKAALAGLDNVYQKSELTSYSIRETLLSRGNGWINFHTLVKYCWEIGIPVLHLSMEGIKKMQGLAISIDRKPVIVLTSKYKHGYLVFDLAHELGHILLGHTDEEIVIDEKISFSSSIKEREYEANKFALEILTGNTINLGKTYHNPSHIADYCIKYGKENKIDPLHIALNIAHNRNSWSQVNVVIRIIKDRLKLKATDPDICRAEMLERLDFDAMRELEQPMRVLTQSQNRAF